MAVHTSGASLSQLVPQYDGRADSTHTRIYDKTAEKKPTVVGVVKSTVHTRLKLKTITQCVCVCVHPCACRYISGFFFTYFYDVG